MTGFLIDQFFVADEYLGAEQAIVLSASSKTALGYASSARASDAVKTIGVTSAANREFVESVGLYDQVIAYDEIGKLQAVPSVVVDMAGAGAAVAAVHERLGDLIAHSMVVGKSHHDAEPARVPSGPQPTLFFAPTAMGASQSKYGADGYARRTKDGLASFIDASREWLHVEHHVGAEAAQSAWQRLFAGDVSPSVGLVATVE
jgi:Protein of unknown function (DUF2855)